MSDSRTWSSPPDFNDAPRGYWGYEVDRLISDLESAHRAGRELGPIISERKLSEVGFGYDMGEVDSYLSSLPGGRGAREVVESEGGPNLITPPQQSASHQSPPTQPTRGATATTQSSPVQETQPPVETQESDHTDVSGSVAAESDEFQPWNHQSPATAWHDAGRESPPAPHRQASPAQTPAPPQEYEVLEPYVSDAASSGHVERGLTGTGGSAAMLAEIRRGRLLGSPAGMQTGYDSRDVDRFLSHLEVLVQNDQSIAEALENCRLNYARQGTPGYDTQQVDTLLNRLKSLAPATTMDAGALSTQYQSRQITRRPVQSAATTVMARIIRIVVFVGFIFFILTFFWS